MPSGKSFTISCAVVRRWMSTLAGLSNWFGTQLPAMLAATSFALSIAPFVPTSLGVSTSSAP
jgi:hypothetical protein